MKSNAVAGWIGVGLMAAGLVVIGGAPSNLMGYAFVPGIAAIVVGAVIAGWSFLKSRRAG